MKKILSLLLILLLFTASQSCKEEYIDYASQETKEQKDQRMRWWRDAKFGMFIHWGGYSHLGGVYKGDTIKGVAEWLQYYKHIPADEYASLIKKFDPVYYNAESWAELSKRAGMKYLVITSKHHEGLAMWDSKVTDFDIVDHTAYGKDVLKPLSEACKKEGVKFCTYHSILDWHYPEANKEKFPQYRDRILKPQLKEIMETLDPEVMWFDGEWIEEWTEEQGKDLYNYLRNMMSELIINNRVGKGRNGMQGMSKDGEYVGDFGTPEQEILEHASTLDWESCMTMNDSWGFKYGDTNWKTPETLIYNLVDVVSKGGNYLLNIGPDAKGRIPESCINNLKEMGDWLSINGEAIYGTVRSEHYKESDKIRYTSSKDGKTVFATCLEWPGNTLKLKYYKPNGTTKVQLLGNKKLLSWDYDDENGFIIHIPEELNIPENRPCNYAWVFKFEGILNEVCEMPEIISANKINPEIILFTNSTEIQLKTDSISTIYYTLDGSVPDKISSVYDAPIIMKESGVLKTVAYSPKKISSPVRELSLVKTEDINGVTINAKPAVKYSGSGDMTLVDKERGSENFQDGKWLGFEGEDFEVLVDLGKVKRLNKIRIGFMHQSGAWIFHPKALEFKASNDGDVYETIHQINNEIDKNTADGIIDFKAEAKFKARYIKIKAKNIENCPSWHAGAGGKAWIFVDELMIE